MDVWKKHVCFPDLRICNNIIHHTYYGMARNLAGRYSGRLLKLWHLAESTLGVEQVLAIHSKWLIECARNWTWLGAGFGSVRMKLMMKCDWNYTNRCYTQSRLVLSQQSLQWLCTCCLDSLPRVTSQLFFHLWCPKPFRDVMFRTQLSMVNSMLTISLARLAADKYTWKLWLCNNDDITLWNFLADEIWRIAFKTPNPPKYFPAKISGHTIYGNWKGYVH